MPPAELHDRLDEALAALRAGELVIYPTETFYGLAADPESPAALEKIFAVKGRRPDQPIALIAADSTSAFALAIEVPESARRLAAVFWPGPLTIVLPARPDLHPAIVGPSGVGVRVSSHPIARALAAGLGRPITATSANLTGDPPVAAASRMHPQVRNKVKVILEAGVLPGDAPSTVVECTARAHRIVRAGAIGEGAISAALANCEHR